MSGSTNVWSKRGTYLVSKTSLLPEKVSLPTTKRNPSLFIEINFYCSIRFSVADENVAGRTMDAETKLFLDKIEKLLELASAMKILEPSRDSELGDIELRLRNLSTFVKKDKCLNAGGKFEWVDSVLVKVFRR